MAAAIFTALVTLSSSTPARGGDEDFTPVYRPVLEVTRAPGGIVIDGEIGDPGWVGASRAGNFVEHSPGDQTRPHVMTEAWMTYDGENLYVAFLCYDDPSTIRASFTERDRIFSDDYVILLIDTYGEATHAYEIAANPYGIPGDLLFSTTNGEDISYDMIFESEGRITEFGWVVEIAVPFSSLRFPDAAEQVWRVDFWRNRPRECRYQYSWAAYDRDEDCWPCQWGTVTGIADVEPGAGLELLPSVVAYQYGSLEEDGRFENDDPEGELSLGISYDISSELTAEATFNPDFSQVEADVQQIDVNTTFALFYPEKRPFFQEGSDLFDTDFNAVYTRSINDPSAAGKLTWRNGSGSVAFLSALDERSVIILPFEERSEFVENGRSLSNALRVRHDLGEQSHVGIVATDRRFEGGGSGSLAGVDGKIRLSASNSLEFQLVGSHTEEVDNPALGDSSLLTTGFGDGRYTGLLDGETFYGHGLNVELGRNTGSYYLGADYRELSPTFRADNGFEPSNNWRMADIGLGAIKRFDEGGLLENVEGDVHAARKWNFDGVRKDEWVTADMTVRFRKGQTGIHSNYMRSNELFRGVQFDDIWQAHACFSTQPSRELRFGVNYNYGHRIARRDLEMGRESSWGAWADLKPIDRLMFDLEYRSVKSEGLDTGERLFSQSIFWSRTSLQFTRRLSLRIVAQYDDSDRAWDVDPLITYRLNSLSVFYLGSTRDYGDLAPGESGASGWTLVERQYFLKFQYLFHL